MKKPFTIGVAVLFLFGLATAPEARANGILPVIIHTCDAYSVSKPNKAGKVQDAIGTYIIIDSGGFEVASAEDVEVRTTEKKHCLGVVDVDAGPIVLDGLLYDELFITVKTCHGTGPGDTCAFGDETEVITDLEPIDTVLGDVVQGFSGITDDLEALLAQEILDRQAGDNALQSALDAEISDRQAADAVLQALISGNTVAIGNNSAAITTNAAGIATNASGIATNASGIAGNAGGIATNTSGIATNASGIATNASGIAGNAGGIATNTSGIATNASGIATNASGIATNASGIATNASGIAGNASGIATNASGIVGLGNGIAVLGSAVTVVQGDIASLELNKQNRVFESCPPGSSIRVVNSDGSVNCEVDNDSNTTYSAGNGLVLSGTNFSIDTSVTQARVTDGCPAGSSIRAITASGSVICELDDAGSTTYSAGDGLALSGTTFSLDNSGVTTAKIANGAVTNAKVTSVTASKITDGTFSGSTYNANGIWRRSTCPSGYSFVGGTNGNTCWSGWRQPENRANAQRDCFDEGAHMCTYDEFYHAWASGSNPAFFTNDAIGDRAGDDLVLCANNTTDINNFDGECNKNSALWYRCCMGFGR